MSSNKFDKDEKRRVDVTIEVVNITP